MATSKDEVKSSKGICRANPKHMPQDPQSISEGHTTHNASRASVKPRAQKSSEQNKGMIYKTLRAALKDTVHRLLESKFLRMHYIFLLDEHRIA
jgi:hypothetical protein